MRHEIKYIVPISFMGPLRSLIMPFVNPDKHVKERDGFTYTVRSIYFDTPDLLFYKEKIEGVPYRLKLRVRSYDTEKDQAPVFMEIKRKHRVPMTKNRSPLTFEKVKGILEKNEPVENDEFSKDVQSEDFKRFAYQLHKGSLSPTVLVVYDREPYEAKDDNTVRITFDKNLRSRPVPDLNDLYSDSLKSVMVSHFILEVKYNRYYPDWMQAIANSFNLKQTSASKYCMSMENHEGLLNLRPWQLMQLRPDLRRNV